MKELVEHIARALVDDPDQVQVTEVVTGADVLIELRVAPADMGRMIGKNGKLISSLRTLVQAAGLRSARRVQLELIED
ncbi:MAG TPA: KH domain-containing protein [Anaerolineales bacterium]|nr:KH domain-containing protein [Anaerolineales bacterium]